MQPNSALPSSQDYFWKGAAVVREAVYALRRAAAQRDARFSTRVMPFWALLVQVMMVIAAWRRAGRRRCRLQ